MELFSLENALNLGVLIFLQAVLGFDNLLYISIESQRAPAEDQARVRKLGITIALVLRVVLLFLIMSLLQNFSAPLFSVHWAGVLEGEFNFSTIVFLLGGGFLMYTAVKEISHLLAIEHLESGEEAARDPKSANQVIAMIVTMNLIFSFDSILSALAITDVFFVLAAAIVVLVVSDLLQSQCQTKRAAEQYGSVSREDWGAPGCPRGRSRVGRLALDRERVHVVLEDFVHGIAGDPEVALKIVDDLAVAAPRMGLDVVVDRRAGGVAHA